MADVAGGAVCSLLAVIRDEAKLLGGVSGDVQFIKEEMESMNSFLMHLARKTPRSGEHDEQVRTWMKQVRDLARDCSNCIEVYLRRGNPAVYRARGILLGYVWWVPWFVKKTVAQHLAATQLSDLKARARDVGERRLRYGVEVPAKADSDNPLTEMVSSSSIQAAAGVVAEGDHDFEDDYYRVISDDPRRELAFSEPRIFYKCTEKLMDWLEHQHENGPFQAIAVAAPDEEDGSQIIYEALDHNSVKEKFDHIFSLCVDMFIFEASTPTAGENMSYSCLPEPLDFVGNILEQLEGQTDESVEEFGEEEIDEKIGKIEEKIEGYLEKASNIGYRVEPLGVICGILRVLLQDTTADEDQNQTQEKILDKTAQNMKKYLESAGEMGSCRIGVEHPQYVAILRELLPKQANTNKLVSEDHIVKKIKDITLKIQVHITPELLPVSVHQQAKSVEESGQDCKERIEQVLERIKEHLLIQETVGRVREHLQGTRTLVVLQNASGYKWDKTKEALQGLGCSSMAVVVTTKYMKGANDFCNGVEVEPIVYSSIEYYHKTALQLTNRRVNDDEKYSAKIFLEILGKCWISSRRKRRRSVLAKKEKDQFCIKMFIHALFANPTRSREELDKLSNSLDFRGSLETNGHKMIKFSYNDLPREYKTCLLYLAIFHEGEKINRSRLIGRWVAEGLITRQDWTSSVSQAEHCLEVLAALWLVCPCDVGAAGKVKSITVHKQVYNFIKKRARKEHILDTRLSGTLARHFSLLSNIRLRSSNSILDFLKQPSSASSQLQLIKVLDLEGCPSLKDNQRRLKNVCTLLILLKYLSLRKTDVNRLPKEINRLQQLEVLDIRQTPMNASAIKYLMLLKLKRLLAGRAGTGGGGDASMLSTIQMPYKVKKMTDLEVLSHVHASEHRHAIELIEIGQLWQLRVLRVVIYDLKVQLENLLQGISDLECLRSLSIEIKPPAAREPATTPDVHAAGAINAHCKNTPKLLESLSISGVTMYGCLLLQLFTRDCPKLAKVTLHNTLLNLDDMESLADLPNLRGLRLSHVTLHTGGKLIIKINGFQGCQKKKKINGFQNLKYLSVDGGGITDINFEITVVNFKPGKAPKLEKIVWLVDGIESLSGINNLPKLKEIVFNDGVRLPDQVKQAMEDHPNFIDYNRDSWQPNDYDSNDEMSSEDQDEKYDEDEDGRSKQEASCTNQEVNDDVMDKISHVPIDEEATATASGTLDAFYNLVAN